VALPVIRLITISMLFAVALPVAPATAGWRDGYYYDDQGWGGEYYVPAPRRPVYGHRDYQSEDGDFQDPWSGRGYAPRYRGESAYDDVPDGDVVPTWRPQPPRNVGTALPDRAYAVPGRRGAEPPLKKPVLRPKVASAALVPRPAATQAPISLPVPRPNLESMDFDSAMPPAAPPPQAAAASQAPNNSAPN
jgi:hypothetical protein